MSTSGMHRRPFEGRPLVILQLFIYPHIHIVVTTHLYQFHKSRLIVAFNQYKPKQQLQNVNIYLHHLSFLFDLTTVESQLLSVLSWIINCTVYRLLDIYIYNSMSAKLIATFVFFHKNMHACAFFIMHPRPPERHIGIDS